MAKEKEVQGYTMDTRRVKITTIDEMLETNPSDKDIHARFISSKAPDAESRKEELEHMPVEEMVEREQTVFFRNPENPDIVQIPCYHMYGNFKQSCGFLRKIEGTASSKITSYKKTIDGLIKCYPDANDKTGRFIDLHIPEGLEIGNCQRPLRISGPMGERVALANSEKVPAGTWFEVDICTWDKKLWPAIEEWLDHGSVNGLGQWRNSGKGAYMWEYV